MTSAVLHSYFTPFGCSTLHYRSYGQALAAMATARGELERQGVPHRRPDDYLAEMLKTDQHMQKVRVTLS
jgi:biotin carboxylase